MANVKIVFDMDDVLWDFDGRVCKRIGLDKNRVVTFKVSENPLLNDEEKDTLRRAYADASIFDNIVWYDGINRISELTSMGADVHISSNCAGEEVAIKKHPQLLSALKLPEEKIHLNVIKVDTHHSKNIGSDVYAFIDDNPHNVAESDAKYNFMPIQPWNSTPEAKALVKHKKVIYCKDLNEIINNIKSLLREKMEKEEFAEDMTTLKKKRKSYEKVPRHFAQYSRLYRDYTAFLEELSSKYHMDYTDLAMTSECY